MVELIYLAVIGMQIAYALSVCLVWGVLLWWYEWGYFEKTGNSTFLKMANGFLMITMGFGYWTAKRLEHHGPFKKRIYLFGYILLFILAFIILYFPVSKFSIWLDDRILDLYIAIFQAAI